MIRAQRYISPVQRICTIYTSHTTNLCQLSEVSKIVIYHTCNSMSTTTSVCPCCSKTVKDNCGAIECDLCKKWFHLKCSLLSSKSYKHYSITNDLWLCTLCKSEVFPFHNLNNPEIIEISFNSNAVCLCSKHICNLKLGSLPRLEVLSSIRSIPNLSDLYVDEHLPLQTNFKCTTPHMIFTVARNLIAPSQTIIFRLFTVISEA